MPESKKSEVILHTNFDPHTVAEGVHLVATQGNGVVVETTGGLVIVDAGPGAALTERMIDDVRSLSDAPVRAIIYSHGHIGYNAGVPQWLDSAASRGEPAPELIAQKNVLDRYHRYQATRNYQMLLNSHQFPRAKRESLETGLTFTDPTRTFGEQLTLEDPDRSIEVFAAPSETDDSLGLWIPGERVLYGGPCVINGFPNVGTPLRVQRLTNRWIASLEYMIGLGAAVLIPEFGEVVVGAEAIHHRLTATADALRWLEAEVVQRLNRGMTDIEIIHDLPDPGDRFEQPYLNPNYGSPDYVVRDICREHGGWWTSKNPTDLHPSAPDATALAILSVIDPEVVLAAAQEHFDRGEFQLALHVVDLIALAPGDDEGLSRARLLKADCCEKLARQTDPFVSRSLYFSSAKLLRAGMRRWSEAPDGLDGLETESA